MVTSWLNLFYRLGEGFGREYIDEKSDLARANSLCFFRELGRVQEKSVNAFSDFTKLAPYQEN